MAFATRKNTLRILSLLIAIGCLYVMTLTVSRGAVLAVAVGIVLAGRHLLKMGFLPILLLVCIGWGIVELGVFEQSTRSYEARGTEDTGRLSVWPSIINNFLESPLIGVGHANVGAVPEGKSLLIKPHNSFLYLAQSSGIVPLALFIAYWLRSARSALREDVRNSPDAAFYIPLLGFTFVMVNLSGLTFMQLWAIVSLAIPMTAGVRRALSEATGEDT
jgi:O-antigen ligase